LVGSSAVSAKMVRRICWLECFFKRQVDGKEIVVGFLWKQLDL